MNRYCWAFSCAIFFSAIFVLWFTLESSLSHQPYFILHGHGALRSGICKTAPGTTKWPSLDQWAKFEQSLSSPLLRPVPPASVCHHNNPSFSSSKCDSLRASWASPSFHASDPISVDFPNWDGESCLPDGKGSCTGSAFPSYVVNASRAEDIAQAVNFAREHNIRLVVKGTGHCYLGRSTAPNSLSLWTRHLRGLEWTSDFQPAGCPFLIAEPAVTVMAGMQMGEIYAAADEQNMTIVGGLASTAGIGGYVLGGGHSPLSASHGLAADQVLEMHVVTAAGEMLRINECQHPDLFWAMRGGGGNAFGVLLSVTIKTFPTPRIISHGFSLAFGIDSENFWATCVTMHSLLPRLVDAGIMGYYFCRRTESADDDSQVGWVMIGPDKDMASVVDTLEPVLSQLQVSANQTIYSSYGAYLSFASWFAELQDRTPAGINRLIGSRLLDLEALTNRPPVLNQVLRSATPPGGIIAGCLVSGPGVWNATPRGGGNAVHLAWRTAYSLEIVPVTWEHRSPDQQLRWSDDLTLKYMKSLRELAPQTGTYLNEADPREPYYRESMWGLDNWNKLTEIKSNWDPHGVFYCRRCIGSEDWVEIGGGLCKKS